MEEESKPKEKQNILLAVAEHSLINFSRTFISMLFLFRKK